MKNKIIISILATFTFGMMGCTASISTGTNTANTATKPANAPANTAANTGTASKTEKTKGEKLSAEKKPEGKSNKAKEVSVPADWVYVYNEQRGYGFSVPAGSTGGGETIDGVDAFMATTPAPSEVVVYVFAFKDEKLSKEDLLDRAEKALAAMGETVQTGKLTGDSEDYSVAEATMTNKNGTKSKAKVLVGTDVSDNYVMIVGTTEDKFAANEKIIDEIWGSFEMWSGGASGDN